MGDDIMCGDKPTVYRKREGFFVYVMQLAYEKKYSFDKVKLEAKLGKLYLEGI